MRDCCWNGTLRRPGQLPAKRSGVGRKEGELRPAGRGRGPSLPAGEFGELPPPPPPFPALDWRSTAICTHGAGQDALLTSRMAVLRRRWRKRKLNFVIFPFHFFPDTFSTWIPPSIFFLYQTFTICFSSVFISAVVPFSLLSFFSSVSVSIHNFFPCVCACLIPE